MAKSTPELVQSAVRVRNAGVFRQSGEDMLPQRDIALIVFGGKLGDPRKFFVLFMRRSASWFALPTPVHAAINA